MTDTKTGKPPTHYEGWWEVPAGLLLASQLAAMDLPRIPGGPAAGIVQAENWHAYGRDDNFRLYRLSESLPSSASAAQLEAADAKRIRNRVYWCEECGAWSEQALPRYPLGDLLLNGIEARHLCGCCRHITRLTGYQAYYAARRAQSIAWAARMAAPGAALAVTASEIRPAAPHRRASGTRSPASPSWPSTSPTAAKPSTPPCCASPPARCQDQGDAGPRARRGQAARRHRRPHADLLARAAVGALRPILAPNSRHTRLGEEAQTRVTNWRSDLDVRIGHLRVATDPGRPDRLALLIRRIAAGAPDGTALHGQEGGDR